MESPALPNVLLRLVARNVVLAQVGLPQLWRGGDEVSRWNWPNDVVRAIELSRTVGLYEKVGLARQSFRHVHISLISVYSLYGCASPDPPVAWLWTAGVALIGVP